MIEKTKYFLLLSFLIFNSCLNENIVFVNYNNIDGSWDKKNQIEFSFDSNETTVDLSLLIRSDSSYPFSNIYLITTIDNNQNTIVDTINHTFQNNNSKWYNLQSSGINNSKILLKKNFKIFDGKFNFKVRHSIRYLDSVVAQTKLDGILDVGLIVEKSVR
tara:strand:- start:1900 stop:2379 length:480 start_codon:yes stop_codon:yes gene_type:complete